MNIKRNYLFFPDIEPGKPDAKLRFRIRYDHGKIVAFNVGYRIEVKKWSKETQRCVKGTTHGKKKVSASEINKTIQFYENTANSIFKNYEVEFKIPQIEEFRALFNKEIGNTSKVLIDDSFFDIFDDFIITMGRQNDWTTSTRNKFNSIKVHLKNFYPELKITKFDEDLAQEFLVYMQRKGFRNTTMAKNVAFIKWFLRWAFSKGYYTGNLHDTWKPKFKGVDGNQKEVIHLSWEELMRLYNLEFPTNKKYLERVRDVFCFTCFTGLRYSDVAKLSRSDIKDSYISIITLKTTDGLKIELNKYSKAILEKYSDVTFENGKALPVISNVKMNLFLKELGVFSGFNESQRIVYYKGSERIEEVHPKHELLTTHCGRRTFIVNALRLGVPAEVIMKWTGHSDFKAMKPYIKIVDELKVQEMNKFNLK